MNYPIWQLDFLGGGLLIAIIAIIHVYIAHFAVGGGFFLVFTEKKGYREKSQDILDFTKYHAKFFMLLTMVFGSMTGVGIWFVISLLSPEATSVLIQNFVFFWAIEWICFTGEIVSLFVYYYMFDRMDHKSHIFVGWCYIVFAWLSLFFINGIISFMLTPGLWVQTHDVIGGFFNPSSLPALIFRTLMALILTGIFGFVSCIRIKNQDVKDSMIRYCAKWLLIPLVMLPIFACWYLEVLTPVQKDMALNNSREVILFIKAFVWLSAALAILGLTMAIRMPEKVKSIKSFIVWPLILIGLMNIGSFEWIREASRKPYIIYDYLYSNGIYKNDVAKLNQTGILPASKWSKYQSITRTNAIDAGKDIFFIECSSCHSIGGPMNDILKLTKKYDVFSLDSQLNGMGKLIPYMPPFVGTERERVALAKYIIDKQMKHKKQTQTIQQIEQIENQQNQPQNALVLSENQDPVIPKFDENQDQFVLLAYSDMGMRLIADCESHFLIKPPGVTLKALLVKRGPVPSIVSGDVDISYNVETGFENPSKHVMFWKYARYLVSKNIPENLGLSKNGLSGTMKFNEVFQVDQVPVFPYSDDGRYLPYPMFSVEAKDKSGNIIAKTAFAAGVSTEIGCKNCHGGNWRLGNIAGLSSETADDILSVHDRINRTQLLTKAQNGSPVYCRDCHTDSTDTNPKMVTLSAAMHGWHSNYLTNRSYEACLSCHSAATSGKMGCLRDSHATANMTCVNCHGYLEDHAIGLLLHEKQLGKSIAEKLMRNLSKKSENNIAPRSPWNQEPDCLSCHKNFSKTSQIMNPLTSWATDKQLFRKNVSEGGIPCQACHGTTHAVYPSVNPYGKYRDTVQPMQYQNNTMTIAANNNCKVCHTKDMEDEMHHENMLKSNKKK